MSLVHVPGHTRLSPNGWRRRDRTKRRWGVPSRRGKGKDGGVVVVPVDEMKKARKQIEGRLTDKAQLLENRVSFEGFGNGSRAAIADVVFCQRDRPAHQPTNASLANVRGHRNSPPQARGAEKSKVGEEGAVGEV